MQFGELQQNIRQRDYKPELANQYFLKLVEEVGELSKAVMSGTTYENSHSHTIKGTIDEELYDVIYYCLAIANIYGIDIEQAIARKEIFNQTRRDH